MFDLAPAVHFFPGFAESEHEENKRAKWSETNLHLDNTRTTLAIAVIYFPYHLWDWYISLRLLDFHAKCTGTVNIY